MKWVTRERPKTDRIACPWLIKNFIDPEAEFLYVPTEQVLEAIADWKRKEIADVDADVASGLESGEDRQVAKMDELINTMRAANGQSSEYPKFDPELEIQEPDEVSDSSQTIGEFKRSLREPEVTDM